MGAELDGLKYIENNSNIKQKEIGGYFNKLGLLYEITKKGNFVGIGTDGKSNDFIKFLQKESGLKYSKGEKKGELMPFDGAISEESANKMLDIFSKNNTSILDLYKKFIKIRIHSKTNMDKKNLFLNTLPNLKNISILNNKINDFGINTKIEGKLLIGNDYKSRQFINYLQYKYKLGIVDGKISNKNAKILLNKIRNKSFNRINKERLNKEKLDLNALKTEIENLDKHGSYQEFVGYYKDKNGKQKYKYIKTGYKPELAYLRNSKYKLKKGETLDRFYDMIKEFGKKYKINDTYRSVEYQMRIYNSQISENKKNGKAITATIPGTSEHHLGLAIDITNNDKSIRTWLKMNAYKYGFARTYKSVQKDGFSEAWHYRYVGEKLATYLNNHNMGMGEFYTRNSKKLNK